MGTFGVARIEFRTQEPGPNELAAIFKKHGGMVSSMKSKSALYKDIMLKEVDKMQLQWSAKQWTRLSLSSLDGWSWRKMFESVAVPCLWGVQHPKLQLVSFSFAWRSAVKCHSKRTATKTWGQKRRRRPVCCVSLQRTADIFKFILASCDPSPYWLMFLCCWNHFRKNNMQSSRYLCAGQVFQVDFDGTSSAVWP